MCSKSQNFTFLPSIFLVPTFLSYPSRNFVWRHLLPKKKEHSNAGCGWYIREIPYRKDVSFSALAWKKNLTNYTKSLNVTCVPLFTVRFPNGIAFLNTVLLFVSNHGNCKNYMFMCLYIPKRGIMNRLHLKL